MKSKDFMFESLSSEEFKKHSSTHWTKSDVVEQIVTFFKTNKVKTVLDIGSGIGKFCILGAQLSDIHFTGVEIRKPLHEEALKILNQYALQNVTLINDDIKNIDFSPFDAFYYYNPFCEHIATEGIIDESIELSEDKYYKYEDIVLQKLEKMNKGTIVILHNAKTFLLSEKYYLVDILQDGELTFWIKIK